MASSLSMPVPVQSQNQDLERSAPVPTSNANLWPSVALSEKLLKNDEEILEAPPAIMHQPQSSVVASMSSINKWEDPFLALMNMPGNPYKILSVPRSEPSFVADKHVQTEIQPSPSPFSRFMRAFDCCRGRKKSENDFKKFQVVSMRSRLSAARSRSSGADGDGRRHSVLFKFDEDQVDTQVLKDRIDCYV